MSKLVEIGRYGDYGEIHIISGYLKSHGIRCDIFDDSASSTFWAYQPAMGGARLMVHEDDAEHAKDLLKEIK